MQDVMVGDRDHDGLECGLAARPPRTQNFASHASELIAGHAAPAGPAPKGGTLGSPGQLERDVTSTAHKRRGSGLELERVVQCNRGLVDLVFAHDAADADR